MTSSLERAVASVGKLPSGAQDEIARIVMELAGSDQPTYRLTPEEAIAMDEADAAVACGDLATDREVAAVLHKHGL